MDKFNLTFNGEILPGLNLAEVKQRLAKALLIDDPARIDFLFSGDIVTLRKNLEKEAAETFYTKMYHAGILVKLEPVKAKSISEKPFVGMDHEFRHEAPGIVEQSWPVSAARSKTKKVVSKKGNAVTHAEEQLRKEAAELVAKKKAEEAARVKAEEAEKRKEAARIKAEEAAAKKKVREEAARLKVEEAAAKKKAREEAARLKAEEAAAKKKAREEAARLKAEEAAAKKRAREEAARLKAVEVEKRKEAARIKAEEAAAKKKAQEEAARLKAEEAAAKKKAKEEAEKLKAEIAAAEEKAREEAALNEAREAEKRRKAAEDAARIKAELAAVKQRALEEESRKIAAELAARTKAEEEARQIEAEKEAARIRIELKRQQDEEMARAKAVDKKMRAEAALRQKAEEEAAYRKSQELKARQAKEKAAAEEAAIQQALQEIAQRKQEEEAAIQQALALAAKQQAKEREASLRAELAEQKRVHAEQAARAKADEERIEAALRELAATHRTEQTPLETRLGREQEENVRRESAKTLQDEQLRREAAKRKSIEYQLEREALKRAAEGTARLKKLQENASLAAAAVNPTVRDPLEGIDSSSVETSGNQAEDQREESQTEPNRVLPKNSAEHLANPSARPAPAPSPAEEKSDPEKLQKELEKHHKKLRPAAPNLFNLKPFRNTVEIRQRAEQSSKVMKAMYLTSLATLLVLSVLAVRFTLLPTPQAAITGIDGIAADPQSALIVAAGLQLFSLDRSGLETGSQSFAKLGLATGSRLLGFDPDGELVMQEYLTSSTDTDPNNTVAPHWRTLRCKLSPPSCQPYAGALPDLGIGAWLLEPRTQNIFLATPASNLLTKLASDGTLLAQATIAMPEQASLALSEGLLYLNSATGPAVGVFRLDDKGFGQQLDEVLLLPPPAREKEQTQVANFIRSGSNWWVTLVNPDTLDAGLYLFDAKWNYLSTVKLETGSYPERLISWSNKVLVADSQHLEIQRFNAAGEAEAPLTLKELDTFIDKQQNTITRSQRLWQTSLGALAILALACFVLGRIQQLRVLVYRRDKAYGADPIDDKLKQIHWVEFDEAQGRSAIRLASIYGLMCLALFVGLVYYLVPVKVIIATALLMLGPAIALTLLHFSRPGHIGVLHDQLILVDHNDHYHIGAGARIRYWGNFLLLDDIVVFIGSRYLHVFSPRALATKVMPLSRAGVKVDTTTVIIKLIQSSHPVARGLVACLVCLAAAVLSLLLL